MVVWVLLVHSWVRRWHACTCMRRFQATSPNIFYLATGEVVYFAAAVGIVYNKGTHTQVRITCRHPACPGWGPRLAARIGTRWRRQGMQAGLEAGKERS